MFRRMFSCQFWAMVMLMCIGCALAPISSAQAECSAQCKRIKRATVIGIIDGRQYLQKSRDMLVVKDRKNAKQLGYTAFVGCQSQGASKRSRNKCEPAVLSTRDAVYLCPNQIKILPSVTKAEQRGFSAYTACDSLDPLPSATPTPGTTPAPETTPIPRSLTFAADSGVRLSTIDSASIIPLASGGYRAYVARSGSSFDNEKIYFSDSMDGLTFSGLTAITGIGPSMSTETLTRPSILQLADSSFSLIYEKTRHISSAGLDLHSLMRAISGDGAAFSNSPANIIIANGSAISSYFNADVVPESELAMRLYYSTISGIRTTTSPDNGVTWLEDNEVSIGGTSRSYAPYPSEPSVVRDARGRFIMFFVSPVTAEVTRQSIFTAESSDGLSFTVHDEPLIVSPEGVTYYGPTVLKYSDGSLRLYYIEQTGPYESVTREMKSLVSTISDP